MSVDDPVAVAEALPALRSVLRDVSDVLESIAVAGLAFPDPDLPDELGDLVDRLRDSGLTEGATRLDALRDALIGDEGSETGRRADRVHAVLAWARLMRAELDLLEVQVSTVRGAAEPERVVSTRRVRPFGIELTGARVTVWALDEKDGKPVILRDALVEAHPLDPLHHPAISRLFQDAVRLSTVLSGTVSLVDHPAAGHGGRRIYAPAFSARPRIGSRAGPPPDPGPLRPGWPGRVRLEVVQGEGQLRVRDSEGRPVELVATPVLHGALLKLLVREGAQVATLDAIVARRHGKLALLAVDDPDEGRVHPACDPRAFPLSRRRIAAAAGEGVAAVTVGAAITEDPDARDALVARLREEASRPQALVDHLRLDLASRALLGMPLHAVGPGPSLEEVSRGLADLDDRTVALAGWLAEARGWRLDVLPAAKAALEARGGPVTDGDLAAVTARTLLRTWCDPDAEVAHAALVFFDAHLAAMQEAWAHPEQPLPEPVDLLLASLVSAWLRGGPQGALDRRVPGVPPDRLWTLTLQRLHRQIAGDAQDQAADISDLLWLMIGGELEAWLFA